MLIEPTLLLDKAKCSSNIKEIVEKARKSNVTFRPHFKTHQSHEIGRWFRDLGVTKITVSSLRMAEYFAADGWVDITVAFPVNTHEVERINSLAKKITLNLLIVSADSIDWLANEVKHNLNLFIEVDTGYHRTGVSPDNTDTLDEILKSIKKYSQFRFRGFLSHDGHTYKVVGDQSKILSIHNESKRILNGLKSRYSNEYPELILSLGDTPSCSVAKDFDGLDEIRPGNLVFYDVTQWHISACALNQIAVAMACPVVATYPDRHEVVVYGGAIHFSKDSLQLSDGTLSFGKVVTLTDQGWSTEETGMYLKSVSQEHGIIHAKKEQTGKIKIGDIIGILPIHSCLTADIMKSYRTLQGEQISMMK